MSTDIVENEPESRWLIPGSLPLVHSYFVASSTAKPHPAVTGCALKLCANIAFFVVMLSLGFYHCELRWVNESRVCAPIVVLDNGNTQTKTQPIQVLGLAMLVLGHQVFQVVLNTGMEGLAPSQRTAGAKTLASLCSLMAVLFSTVFAVTLAFDRSTNRVVFGYLGLFQAIDLLCCVLSWSCFSSASSSTFNDETNKDDDKTAQKRHRLVRYYFDGTRYVLLLSEITLFTAQLCLMASIERQRLLTLFVCTVVMVVLWICYDLFAAYNVVHCAPVVSLDGVTTTTTTINEDKKQDIADAPTTDNKLAVIKKLWAAAHSLMLSKYVLPFFVVVMLMPLSYCMEEHDRAVLFLFVLVSVWFFALLAFLCQYVLHWLFLCHPWSFIEDEEQ